MSKILVVDDEENIRLLYRDEFADLGHDVLLAANGEEALEIVRRERPDLVTLDVRMPGQDGLEVLRRIKEERKDLPVVLVTAYNAFKQDFTTWACDAFVVKSANLDELKATVGRLLAGGPASPGVAQPPRGD
jgi:CheY-like chemotaxis protein